MRGWTMTSNYYVKTFIGDKDKRPIGNKGDFYWTYRKYEDKRITWTMFERAVKNILKFHIILILEYIDTSPPLIERILGWKNPPRQVLPHEGNAPRENKKSIPAIEALSAEDYIFLSRDNMLDVLFFEIVKRIYLERLHCSPSTLSDE